MCVVAVFFFVILTFVSSTIVVEEINSNLQVGETFVGKIEIDFKENLRKEDLKIYDERREVFFEKDLFNYKNTTFFYVIFQEAGNYTLKTENFLYYENNSLKEGRIDYSIFIKNNSEEVLSITPGIIHGIDLSLTLVNQGSSDLEVVVQKNRTLVKVNSSKKILIVSDSDFFYLDVKGYKNFKIPVFYFNLSSNEENNSIENESDEENISGGGSAFEIDERMIRGNLTTNKTFIFGISLKNLLEEPINLGISSNLDGLSFNKTFSLEGLEEKEYPLEFFSEYEGIYSGKINFSFNESESGVEVLLYVLEDEESFKDLVDTDAEDNLACSENGGEICSENQFCSGGSINPLLGFCCMGGTCKTIGEEEKPSKNYFLGIFALLIVGVVGYIVYKKFKETKAKPKI